MFRVDKLTFKPLWFTPFRFLAALLAAMLLVALESGISRADCSFDQEIERSEIGTTLANCIEEEEDVDIDALNKLLERPFEDRTGVGSQVFHGKPGNPKTLTHVVRIAFANASGSSDLCTGVRITEELVLTAAHCSCGRPGSYRMTVQTAESLLLGSFQLSVVEGPYLFPGYDCRFPLEEQAGKDLALFRVETVLRDADLKVPRIISLYQIYKPFHAPLFMVAGFGKTEEGEIPDHIRVAFTRIHSHFCSKGRVFQSRCAPFREFALANNINDPSALPTDSCGGDSGGPVFAIVPYTHLEKKQILEKGSYGKAYLEVFPYQRLLAGITSRAIQGVRHYSKVGCGGGGIYTAVGSRTVLNWLESHGYVKNSD